MNSDLERVILGALIALIVAGAAFVREWLRIRSRMLAIEATRLTDQVKAIQRAEELKQQAEIQRQAGEQFILQQARRTEELNREVARINELRSQDREENAALINEVKNLKEQLGTAGEHARDRDLQLGTLKGNMDALDRENTTLKRRLTELEDSARTLSAINATLRTERDQALTEKLELHAEIARLQERVTALESEREALNRRIEALQAKLPAEAIPA